MAADDATVRAAECNEMEEWLKDSGSMKTDLEASPSSGQEKFAIRCRDVCRSYGKLKVLNNLNLSVPQGQIYGLLGPSGCGKTTLLKCIVGTLKISWGHITVLGKPPAFPGHEVPGKMVGYMPQVPQSVLFKLQKSSVASMVGLSWRTLWPCLLPAGPGVVQRVHHQRHLGLLRANPRADVEGHPSTHGFPHRLPGSTPEEQSGPKPQDLAASGGDCEDGQSLRHHHHALHRRGPAGQRVPATRHPDLSDLPVCRRRPEGDQGRRGEQRDVRHQLQQVAAVLPGQLQRAPDQQIALMLQEKLHSAFQAFVDNKLGSMSYQVALPIKFEEPIYGSMNMDFTTFVTPGAVLSDFSIMSCSITFYLAVGLTALSFVLERKEGLLDRCWVAGVSSLETMLAHLFSQLLVISVQIILLLLFILLVFNMPNKGSLVLIIILIVLQGVTGISFGLVISSAIDDEQSANQAALGIFYPNLILSGIIWPVECIPYPLRYISLALPQTYASEALRCIMYRGEAPLTQHSLVP
ncbi:unnamed protein product [Tetraodon nigroviridis]|uniref:(spotted green pufferfish) hypothetical protein n=1 Tax=Tetraodon nigroviridis TaxID=99883 RepID=Q4SGD1_TETNG|nr:unnamed protein product [Tetraodon nigroviridis]